MSDANDNGGFKISYSYKEAVKATGATRNMLSQMVSRGELDVRRRGRRVFILRDSLVRAFGPVIEGAGNDG